MAPAETRAAPDRTRAQRWAESALAPHPYRLELRGSPASLAWPHICANCGQLASERIVVKKVFRPLPRRHGSHNGLWAYRIQSASIPFCASCAGIHRATVERPPAWKHALGLILHPLIIPVAGFTWLTTVFLKELPTTRVDPESFPAWGVVAFLAAALAWCVFVLWRATAPSRLERQTDVTRACDFSEDVSGFLERPRRIYALRHKGFADAMASLNADRVWTATDQARSVKRSFVLAAVVLAALAGVAGLLKLVGR